MNRIKRISFGFRVLFQLLFISLPILTILAWSSAPVSVIPLHGVTLHGIIKLNFIPHAYVNHIFHPLTFTDRLLGFVTNLIPLTLQLFILYSLIQLFKLYERGEIFLGQNVRYILRIGFALLITQLANPIYEFLMGVALTRLNPPGQRFATITFDQTNIGIILIALLTMLIAWVMAEGCKLREEQRLTI